MEIKNQDCHIGIKEIPDMSVHALITDPPYGVSKNQTRETTVLKTGLEIRKNFGEWDELEGNELYKWLYLTIPKIKHWFVIFCGEKNISTYIDIFNSQGISANVGCWIKHPVGNLTGKYKFVSSWEPVILAKRSQSPFYAHYKDNVFRHNQQGNISNKRIHPTQKPIGLISEIMQCVTKVGDTVLDPFLGSGTTAVACEKLGRNCIGFEKDKTYFEKIQERLKRYESSHVQSALDVPLPKIQRRQLRSWAKKKQKNDYIKGTQSELK